MDCHQYERDGVWYPVPKPRRLRDVIRGALLNALAYTGGSQAEAAAALGISPRVLSYKLKAYDVPAARRKRA